MTRRGGGGGNRYKSDGKEEKSISEVKREEVEVSMRRGMRRGKGS